MTAADLVQRVAACGYEIVVTPAGPVLKEARSECVMPPGLLADLKANRDAVVAFLTTCGLCGRSVGDAEDRERLKDPAHCEQGGANARRDRKGFVVLAAVARCPWKGK